VSGPAEDAQTINPNWDAVEMNPCLYAFD
jgi:hypothetical protein